MCFFMVVLKSTCRKVHEIGDQPKTHLSDGAIVDAIDLLIVNENAT